VGVAEQVLELCSRSVAVVTLLWLGCFRF
jgi:hypothetical protein